MCISIGVAPARKHETGLYVDIRRSKVDPGKVRTFRKKSGLFGNRGKGRREREEEGEEGRERRERGRGEGEEEEGKERRGRGESPDIFPNCSRQPATTSNAQRSSLVDVSYQSTHFLRNVCFPQCVLMNSGVNVEPSLDRLERNDDHRCPDLQQSPNRFENWNECGPPSTDPHRRPSAVTV